MKELISSITIVFLYDKLKEEEKKQDYFLHGEK